VKNGITLYAQIEKRVIRATRKSKSSRFWFYLILKRFFFLRLIAAHTIPHCSCLLFTCHYGRYGQYGRFIPRRPRYVGTTVLRNRYILL